MPERVAIVDFPGGAGDSALLPPGTPEQRAFEAGLGAGELQLQACSVCDRRRFPIAPVCPYCGAETWGWRRVSSLGHVHAWVRYHRAFVPAFESLVPYSVVTVELDEGSRLIGRFADTCEPVAGLRVRAITERWPDGRHVAAFVAVEDPR